MGLTQPARLLFSRLPSVISGKKAGSAVVIAPSSAIAWTAIRLLLVWVLAASLGCTSLGFLHDDELIPVTWHDNPDLLRELSSRTSQILRGFDLETLVQERPREAYVRLQQLALETADPELVFALAELTYLIAQQEEKQSHSHSCAWYCRCAGYCYHYLFGAASTSSRPVTTHGENGPFDPRFGLACNLYNTSLAHCIGAAQRLGQFDPRTPVRVPTPDGSVVNLSITCAGFPWKPAEFSRILLAANYSAIGLTNDYRTFGLGVPLIGVRDEGALRHAVAGQSQTYPLVIGFPITAFVRFDGDLAAVDKAGFRVVEMHNPLTERSILVRGQEVPLEADLSAPLAYSLAHTDFKQEILAGFVDAAKVESRAGIYLFEPYQPGKIPVLMVHGLLSSPLTWAGMYNDLHADPEIREKYQFWFFLYPTGLPWLSSADLLRTKLNELCQRLDPHGEDRALNHVVCIGHSMGGLVSKMLTIDGGDEFFRLASSKPLSTLKTDAGTRLDLQRLFYFEPVHGVERVVFIGTPHHGSRLVQTPLGSLADDLIHLPGRLVRETQALVPVNGLGWRTKLPTSVDLLSPHSPALELLAARQPPPSVHYHSIIGQAPKSSSLRRLDLVVGAEDQQTDGAVPYWSAHLVNAESEVVVPADHLRIQSHPQSVREVRRILMGHWELTRQQDSRGP